MLSVFHFGCVGSIMGSSKESGIRKLNSKFWISLLHFSFIKMPLGNHVSVSYPSSYSLNRRVDWSV